MQDALADAHTRWAVVGSYDDPLAWARRAVLNRAAGRGRRLGREHRALGRVAGRPAPAPTDELALRDDELWQAVRRLPRRQLEVVLLRWFEDLPVREVAALLGCGEESVRTHWRRARARLSDELVWPARVGTARDEKEDGR